MSPTKKSPISIKSSTSIKKGKSFLDRINLHHLLHFYYVLHYGGFEKAGERTEFDKGQLQKEIGSLEQSLANAINQKPPVQLFKLDNSGRRIGNVPSPIGARVFHYAERFFRGNEIIPKLIDDSRLHIAYTSAFPKYLVYYLLRDFLSKGNSTYISSQFISTNEIDLLNEGVFDVVLADGSPPEWGLDDANYFYSPKNNKPVIMADSKLIEEKKLKDNFPQSLNNIPFVLPPEKSSLRRAIKNFFKKHNVQPKYIGETSNRLLLAMFAQKGHAAIGLSSVAVPTVKFLHNLEEVGEIDNQEDNYYALTIRAYYEEKPIVRSIFDKLDEFNITPPQPDWSLGSCPNCSPAPHPSFSSKKSQRKK